MCLHCWVSVYNSLFSFAPDSVKFIQHELKLRFCQLPVSVLNKLFSKRVNFLWYPKSTLRYEGLVTCTKVNRLKWIFWWIVNLCLLVLVDMMQKSDTVVIKSKLGKVLILTCGLEHFQETSRIISEIFILSFTEIKVELFALKRTVLFDHLPFPFPQLRNSLVFLLKLLFQVPDPIFRSGISYSQHWQFIIFLLQHFLKLVSRAYSHQQSPITCSPVTLVKVQVWLRYVVFFVVEIWSEKLVWLGRYLNDLIVVWPRVADRGLMALGWLLFCWLGYWADDFFRWCLRLLFLLWLGLFFALHWYFLFRVFCVWLYSLEIFRIDTSAIWIFVITPNLLKLEHIWLIVYVFTHRFV